MPLNQLDRAIVDIAFVLGAAGNPNYWYGLDRDSNEFADLSAAIRRYTPLTVGDVVDTAARVAAAKANNRLNKLHTI